MFRRFVLYRSPEFQSSFAIRPDREDSILGMVYRHVWQLSSPMPNVMSFQVPWVKKGKCVLYHTVSHANVSVARNGSLIPTMFEGGDEAVYSLNSTRVEYR